MLPLPAAGAGATGDTTMSSTQHQLIEQCATRLRGIVEALDNIHDSTPHRWSTDLDDVHSSAESLLALIKDQAPARSEASFEEWLANELEGEDGQPVPAAVCDIALARRAFNHWPNLEKPAQVGAIRFHAGLSSRLVVEAAQRAYEYKATPEQEAERIERLQAFREQLDPLNLAPHAGAFNEAPAEALKPEQAEAERPEVVAHVDGSDEDWFIQPEDETELHNEGLLFAGCELGRMVDFDRIVGELRAEIAMLRSYESEPVAWVEVIDRDYGPYNFHGKRLLPKGKHQLYAAPVAQAQQFHDLDKQCRDDVARALGLRPSQERGFAWSYLLDSIKSCVKASEDAAQAQHSVPEGYALIPVRETEAMHDAVMALLYKGVARTDTQKLLNAYIAAAPGKEG